MLNTFSISINAIYIIPKNIAIKQAEPLLPVLLNKYKYADNTPNIIIKAAIIGFIAVWYISNYNFNLIFSEIKFNIVDTK